jgi:hypothetical protein
VWRIRTSIQQHARLCGVGLACNTSNKPENASKNLKKVVLKTVKRFQSDDGLVNVEGRLSEAQGGGVSV